MWIMDYQFYLCMFLSDKLCPTPITTYQFIESVGIAKVTISIHNGKSMISPLRKNISVRFRYDDNTTTGKLYT